MRKANSNKQEWIINAAIRLWQQAHDVDKVSLMDIAKEAGVSPTTIYNNFGTREGLIQRVIRQLMENIMEKQDAILRSNLPFPLKMQQSLASKMSSMEGMQSSLLDKFSSDPAVGKYLDKIYDTGVKSMMSALIEDGKKQGYIRPDLSEEMVMLYLDIIKEGGKACAGKLYEIAGDKVKMKELSHIFYCGLFQKDVDFDFDAAAQKEDK